MNGVAALIGTAVISVAALIGTAVTGVAVLIGTAVIGVPTLIGTGVASLISVAALLCDTTLIVVTTEIDFKYSY